MKDIFKNDLDKHMLLWDAAGVVPPKEESKTRKKAVWVLRNRFYKGNRWRIKAKGKSWGIVWHMAQWLKPYHVLVRQTTVFQALGPLPHVRSPWGPGSRLCSHPALTTVDWQLRQDLSLSLCRLFSCHFDFQLNKWIIKQKNNKQKKKPLRTTVKN